MWIPSQLGSAHAETLKKLGLELDPAQLSDPMAYPLGAIVSLGGCSASFVSPDGLVATNHHCVTGALQYNSTPQQNLLEQGYLAKTRADEKSIGPTGRVYVTQAFKDVTFDVRKDIEAIREDQERHNEIEKRTKALLAACEKDRPTVRCEVAAYDGGAQYLLIERLQIKDVRLVYAPHEGIGNFGGEIDNWRWPRHGGDFSFYRAYVGKDGKPAEYSAENVPFKPRQHLKLATKPLARRRSGVRRRLSRPHLPLADLRRSLGGRRLVVPAPDRVVRRLPRPDRRARPRRIPRSRSRRRRSTAV